MLRRFYLVLCGGIILGLALAACESIPNSGSAPPVGNGSSTNNSPGTKTSGPITIATNHSRYAPTEAVQVVVHNTLSTAIYASDTKAGCSILDLEVQQNGSWQPSSEARCSLGRPAQRIEIAPGEEYKAVIQASPGVSFSNGSYRLVLHYSNSSSPTTPTADTSISSQSFVVGGTNTSPPTTVSGTPPVNVPPPVQSTPPQQ